MDQRKEKMNSIIKFIKELERIKDTLRFGYTSKGKQESTAEHTWRLAMLAMILEEDLPHCDMEKVLKLCLIHDIGEAYEGDIPAIVKIDPKEKYDIEKKAISKLEKLLPPDREGKLKALWEEYNGCNTIEAKIVKALDKIETIIQHNQGDNPPEFDYQFNLNYGKEYAMFDETIKMIREIVDEETQENYRKKQVKIQGKERE